MEIEGNLNVVPEMDVKANSPHIDKGSTTLSDDKSPLKEKKDETFPK